MIGETRPSLSDLGVSDLELVAAVFSNPDTYEMLDSYPKRDSTRGGRPQIYPDYLFFAVGCLSRIYDSTRAAITALAGPIVWNYIRSMVRERFPEHPEMWLPEKPPGRCWYQKRKRQLKALGLEPLQHSFTDSAIATVREVGHLDPNGPGTATHPDRSRIVYHDGKTIKQMFNGAPGDTRDVRVTDPITGEVTIEKRPVRADPDAKVHITGDGRQIHGCKFWTAHTRGHERFSRVTLAVDYVPEVKNEKNSEADVAVKNLLELMPRLPGAHGIMCDTVLRGTHIDKLERALGLIVMNPVTAKTRDKKTRERTEKEYYLRSETFSYPGGRTQTVDIWTTGGRLVRIDYADDGTEIAIPLERLANITRTNKNGEHRSYVQYLVPDPSGGPARKIMEPTYNTPGDTFNRAENVRQIPPGDPDYVRLMGLRSDAESANRNIDDHLYLRRATSVGAQSQLFDLICNEFVWNSLARYQHGSTAPPARIAA